MNSSPLIASPHAHDANTVAETMGWVLLALAPATLFGIYLFGWPALLLFLVTVAAAVVAEYLSLKIAGKPPGRFLADGSALLTGVLLALTLPPWAPWWVGVVGAVIAIVIAKQVFGGVGQNLFNPAMAARVALLISFPLEMTTFVEPQPLFSAAAPTLQQSLAITFGSGGAAIDAVTSATILDHTRTELGQGVALGEIAGYDPLALAWGGVPGSLGETSALLLLLGGLLLLWRRVITWYIPVALLGTITLLATLFHLIAPESYASAPYHLLSGAVMLVAFFIATDPVTSPLSVRGQLLFGAGCGAFIWILRTWSGYPEGAAFAILLMNAFTPLIDHYIRPRIYGRDRRGVPLNESVAAREER